MKLAIPVYCAAIVLCLSAFAEAGPHLVYPKDPAGAPIREAAAAFYQKVADGDAAGPKAMFAGPAEHAALLEAELRAVAASKMLDASIKAKFGKVDEANGFAQGFRRMADYQKSAVMIVNGDDACVAGAFEPNLGLDLHRDEGAWKVVHLTTKYNRTAAPTKFYSNLASRMDEVRSELDAGKLSAEPAVLAEFNQKLRPLLEEWTVPLNDEQPPRLGNPATQPAPSAVELKSLLGKRADSQEIVAMIDSLPATPRLTVLAGQHPSMWINSYETGLSVYFSLRDGLMMDVTFYADGREGFCPYKGELLNALKLRETRREVERAIGPPVEMGPASHRGVEAYYPKLGLRLIYGNDVPRDPQNPLVQLSLSEPTTVGRATTLPNYDGTVHLAFRLVVPDWSLEAHLPERFVNANDGTAAFVSTTVIVNERDIDDASATRTEKGAPAILLKIGAAGAARLEAVSAANAGRQMAIIVDKQLLMAPMIRGKMGANVMIEMGSKGNEEETFALAQKLRRAIYALPAEGTR